LAVDIERGIFAEPRIDAVPEFWKLSREVGACRVPVVLCTRKDVRSRLSRRAVGAFGEFGFDFFEESFGLFEDVFDDGLDVGEDFFDPETSRA